MQFNIPQLATAPGDMSVPSAAAAAAAAAASSPGGAPPVTAPTPTDWVSTIETILSAESDLIDKLALTGINAGLATVPFGTMLEPIVDSIAQQFLARALTAFEAWLASEGQQVAAAAKSNSILAMALSFINTEAPLLSAFLGPDKIASILAAAAARLGIQIA